MIGQDMGTMVDLDPNSLSNQDRYKLLIGSVLPRPIAFVSTMSVDGVPNLAPFSFFTVASSSPMRLCFVPMIRGSDGHKKDTLNNIEATGECVVHIVTETIAEAMNETAGEYPPDVSEFEVAGFTPVPSVKVKPFRVKESPIQMECKLYQVVSMGDTIGSGSLVIVEVVHMHFAESVYQDGKISLQALRPVGRLAGTSYTKVTDTFDLHRPMMK